MRGKGIYITFALLVSLAVLTVFVVGAAMQVGVVMQYEVAATEGYDVEHFNPFMQQEVITGARAAQMSLVSMDVLIYFFLPLIVIVAMSPFSSSAVKNELTIGISRVRFYFSKLMLSSILSVAFMVVYVLLFVVFGTIRDGFGNWGGGLGIEVLQAFAAHMLFALAFNSVGMFFCFVVRRAGATEGLYIAFALAPQIVIALLMIAFPEAIRALYFDLGSLFGMFAQVSTMYTVEIVRGLLVGLAWLVVPTMAGIALFQKADIK